MAGCRSDDSPVIIYLSMQFEETCLLYARKIPVLRMRMRKKKKEEEEEEERRRRKKKEVVLTYEYIYPARVPLSVT